jgi:hypothetical protein
MTQCEKCEKMRKIKLTEGQRIAQSFHERAFMGSGSTGVAANKLGFKFIGIEKEKEYFEIAEKRCEVSCV